MVTEHRCEAMKPRTDAGRVVLLVQRHDDTREMYAEFLRHNGLTPIAVSNGTDAVNAAPGADVVVTGIALNGDIDGVELIGRLRHDERTNTTPIIVLTGCVQPTDRQRAEDAGCEVFLEKPCLPEALLREVRRMLAVPWRRANPRSGSRHAPRISRRA